MESAHDAVGRTGLVILDKLRSDTRLAVALFVVSLAEIAACVVEHLRFDDEETFDGCFYNIHIYNALRVAKR